MLFKAYTNLLQIPLGNICRFSSVRQAPKNHYEVLGVSKKCCTKDIKNAFVKLSKAYHPDVNNGNLAHHQFLKISEAYNVLSKPHTRMNYDMELQRDSVYGDLRSIRHRARSAEHDFNSPFYWAHRHRYRDPFYNKHDYYARRAFNNKVIAVMCLLFSATGAIIQFYAIRHSVTLKREFMLSRSMEHEIYLTNLQTDAERNGNELQLQLLEQRMADNEILLKQRQGTSV